MNELSIFYFASVIGFCEWAGGLRRAESWLIDGFGERRKYYFRLIVFLAGAPIAIIIDKTYSNLFRFDGAQCSVQSGK